MKARGKTIGNNDQGAETDRFDGDSMKYIASMGQDGEEKAETRV